MLTGKENLHQRYQPFVLKSNHGIQASPIPLDGQTDKYFEMKNFFATKKANRRKGSLKETSVNRRIKSSATNSNGK